jgi:hypothetical protein
MLLNGLVAYAKNPYLKCGRHGTAEFGRQATSSLRQGPAPAALPTPHHSPTIAARGINSLPVRCFQLSRHGGFMVAVQSRINRACFVLAMALSASLLASTAQAYTPEQQQACTPDAFRLCGDAIPDVDRVTACMIRKRSELSPACRAYFRSPEPVAAPVTMARRPVRITPVSARRPVSVKPKKPKKPARPASAT